MYKKYSYVSAWNNRCSFMWAVERPVPDRSRFSPKFKVNDCEHYLVYSVSSTSSYSISIVWPNCGYQSGHPRLSFYSPVVHVVDSEERVLPLSRYTTSYTHDTAIWGPHEEAAILEAVPDFLTNGLLRFVVTFTNAGNDCYDFTIPPPMKAIKMDSYAQTDGETVQKLTRSEDQSVQKLTRSEEKSVQMIDKPFLEEDKSVQTPPYLDSATCLASLGGDLSKLLDQDARSDLLLSCGDHTIRAHKLVLSTRSKVFAAMLQNDMSESQTGIVVIQDVNPAVFGHFVRYLYTGDLPDLTVDTARSFYEAADKYAVPALMRRCSSFLQENLDPENVFETLILADAHSDAYFKENVMDYILQKEIHLQYDIWLPFCKSHPMLAVEVLNRSHQRRIK